jgi:catechol 2,3-dioxygenase-like lactoylglutathione lyase family enzyme
MSAVSSLLLCLVLQSPMFASRLGEQAEGPRITGIDHVTIYVSDVTKSRQFYSNVMGLTIGCPSYAGRETCFLVRPSDQRLLLKPAPTDMRNNAHKSWLAEVGFATDNVSHTRDYLLAHGFRPGPMQKDSDGAQYFRVRDPEGNPIAFVQRVPGLTGYDPASKQLSSHMIHAGFVVKDLAAENRFYVELLGFRLYWHGGFKDDGTDWYELQVPDGPDWVEYMLNIPANADKHELGVQNHLSFGVKDVHTAAAELRARGLQTFDGPERSAATAKTVWMPTIQMAHASRSWSSLPCRNHAAIPTQRAIRSRDKFRRSELRESQYYLAAEYESSGQ